jgi:hypothetical protein
VPTRINNEERQQGYLQKKKKKMMYVMMSCMYLAFTKALVSLMSKQAVNASVAVMS